VSGWLLVWRHEQAAVCIRANRGPHQVMRPKTSKILHVFRPGQDGSISLCGFQDTPQALLSFTA
jgi:hypothetical protein